MKINGTSMSMIRGDTETITINCTNVDGSSVAFMAGDKIYFTVKKRTTDVDFILQKIVEEFADGVAIIELSSLDTKNLDCSTYKYDMRLVQDGGVITLIPASLFSIEREVGLVE